MLKLNVAYSKCMWSILILRMKKILNLCLLLSSLLGYLEWGGGQHSFLGQAEFELLFGSSTTDNFAHPFVLIPLAGQLLLFITLFQKTPSRILTYIGLGSLSLLLLFMFAIGIMSMNFKIIASVIPFIVFGVLVIRANRRGR